MKSIFFSSLVFFLLFSTLNTFAKQDIKQSAKLMLEERDSQIKSLIGDRKSDFPEELRLELQSIINDVIDYCAMAKHALQNTWDDLTAKQQDEFVEIFSTIIRDQSLNSLDIYRAEVTYDTFTIEGENKVTARTIATLDNVRTPVIYEMLKENGEWIVIDMSVDNVSTADSYRRSFQNIIRRRGYDALLDNLKRRAGVS